MALFYFKIMKENNIIWIEWNKLEELENEELVKLEEEIIEAIYGKDYVFKEGEVIRLI